MQTEKIFITGGTGFLGAYMLRMLVKKGFAVRALKRATSSMDLVQDVQDQVEWIEGDILEIPVLEDAMQGIDKVYHAAALVSFDPRDKQRLMKINTEGTANVVNVALYRNVKKLAYVSSIAAVGRSANSPIVNENTAWENSKINTQYAISKHLAELEVWRGTAEGLPAVIVNPTIIVGAGNWNASSCKFFQQIDNGLKFYTGGSTGFVEVRDVAHILIKLMESDIQNERYILNAENTSYLQFFQWIARYIHQPPPTVKANQFIKEMVWRVEWLRSLLTGSRPLITKETARTSSHSYQYQNDKIINALQYKFMPIEDAVKAAAAVYLQSKADNLGYGVFDV